MSHVFISYSKKNKDYARRLADYLLENGFDVWIDDKGIRPADDWQDVMYEAVQSCAACIVVMTAEARTSKWVKREVAWAEESDKKIFPLLRDGEKWPILVLTQYADVRDGSLPDNDFLEALRRHVRFISAEAKRLLDIMLDVNVPPPDCAEAGRNLAKLGDPRPGVGLRPDRLPDIDWVEIPAGPFLMGSTKVQITELKKKYGSDWQENEKPQHPVELPTYWIARYPVTVSQYEVFIKDGGYQEQRWWTDAGWDWKGDKTRPEYGWDDTKWHIANHPVIGVTWYEAFAFTQWLSGKKALSPLPLLPQGEGEKYREMARQVAVDVARELRKQQTDAESSLWECLRDRRLGGIKIRRQHPIANTTFVVDFFCYESNLIIEVDGPIHRYQGEADRVRQRELEGLGYRVLRFTNEQVLHQLEDVLTSILETHRSFSLRPEGEGPGMRANWVIRLPTEQEWEKAARGIRGRIYPWGNNYIPGFANIDEIEMGLGPSYLKRTTPVGMYPQGASLYGVLDMSGNVREWCLTQWRDRYKEPENNDLEGTTARVLRGGSWNRSAPFARCAFRYRLSPAARYDDIGFRVVYSAPS